MWVFLCSAAPRCGSARQTETDAIIKRHIYEEAPGKDRESLQFDQGEENNEKGNVRDGGDDFPLGGGKTLKLNGVAYRKALGFVKVYVVGLYLENPTQDPQQVIESEQVKHMVTHYLTSMATAKKLSEGFVETIEKCNPPELVQAHKADIETYASWLDKDMKPGLTSVSTYLPGKGLTLVYQGEERGTIPGKEFAQMYYRYNVGEKAQKNIRQGLLGQ